MENFLITIVVTLILGLAIWSIRISKKKGKHCIGCPHSGSCAGMCSGSRNNT